MSHRNLVCILAKLELICEFNQLSFCHFLIYTSPYPKLLLNTSTRAKALLLANGYFGMAILCLGI